MNISLERTVRIMASRELVFRFFTDSARWAKWWGEGSTVDARVGGKVSIRYPGGVEALGEVLAIDPPERIVFTYGYASGKPIPPGSSRVSIRLSDEGGATRLDLTHEFDDPAVRDQHVQGWRYQLSVFANVAADEAFARAGETVDAWFLAWAETDAAHRQAAFAAVASNEIRFRDRYSALEGVEELALHAGAAQRFLPGIRVGRRGEVRHCQGMVLAEWVAAGADGVERMRGANVFELGADGKIVAVTGLPG
ncbi:MAG: SRPBCC domain-containing protein [Bryobacteraceae bacterium]